GFYRVGTERWPDAPSGEMEIHGLARDVFEHFDALRRKAGLPDEANKLLATAVGGRLSRVPWGAEPFFCFVFGGLWWTHRQRQQLLEASSLSERLRMLIELLDQAEPPVSLASQVTPFLLRGASYAWPSAH